MNALMATALCRQLGIADEIIQQGLQGFSGIARRLQNIGQANGVTVIDDFAHNPDKIAASLQALREGLGQGASLHILFQMHGFGPIKLMGKEIIDAFKEGLKDGDTLCIPEVYYRGGTVDKSLTSKDMIAWAEEQGLNAHYTCTRQDALEPLAHNAKPGDIVAIMGARDDTLTGFAQDLLRRIEALHQSP